MSFARTISNALLAAGLSLAAAGVLAQPRDVPPDSYGDRQSGKWGDPNEGYFGNPAEGNFGFSRRPPAQNVDPDTGRPRPPETAPYVVLDLPADEDQLRDSRERDKTINSNSPTLR